MHFGFPVRADQRTTSNSWGFKTCFLSTLEQRKRKQKWVGGGLWICLNDLKGSGEGRESRWEGRTPGVWVLVLPWQERVAPHLVLEERPLPCACWYLACSQALSPLWTWPLTEGCFGDNISPNAVTVAVVCAMDASIKLWSFATFFFVAFCVLHPSAVLSDTLSCRAQWWFFSEAITMTHHSPENDKHFHLTLVLGNMVRFFFPP